MAELITPPFFGGKAMKEENKCSICKKDSESYFVTVNGMDIIVCKKCHNIIRVVQKIIEPCPTCGCTEMLCGHGSERGCSTLLEE